SVLLPSTFCLQHISQSLSLNPKPCNYLKSKTMEISVSLNASFSLANGFSSARTSSIFPFKRNSFHFSSLGIQFKGNHLVTESIRHKEYALGAVVDDKTEITNDCTEKKVSSSVETDSKGKDGKEDVDVEYNQMITTCDKLIGVFMVDKPSPTDWRKLLAFSRTWSNIRPYFFRRCQERADAEDDPDMKHKLFRFARKLKGIDEDVERHNELLEVVRGATSDITAIVARRRKDFTREFFEHLRTVLESYYANPEEQNALAKLGDSCFAAVEAYDTESESIEALNAAEFKFQDIINSPGVDVARKKIDNLAEKRQLDSATMQMITKAWSATKETDLVKDEAKDIMYHLYESTKGNLQRLLPKEVRILKYILSMRDPVDQLSALKEAFTPGVELQGTDVDFLYTTAHELHALIKNVVEAYHFSREETVIREARDLVRPGMIKKLEKLKKVIEKHYM
ncbi:hypothetical protein AQUCO_01400525v1, partial [Aquilegia coerulea]